MAFYQGQIIYFHLDLLLEGHGFHVSQLHLLVLHFFPEPILEILTNNFFDKFKMHIDFIFDIKYPFH